jgi:HTH-type transcriptional regulator, global nitrogen regulator NrpRI
MSSMDRTDVAILRVLAKAGKPQGAGKVAKELLGYGIDLEERAVRYHLDALDDIGLTESTGRPGRQITPKGRQELERARVADKVGLVSANLEAFAYKTSFDPRTGKGAVALNVSSAPAERLDDALRTLAEVAASRFVTSRRVRVFHAGEVAGTWVIPPGAVGIGTVCSVTVNGVLLKAGIPVQSLFGGLLDIEGGKPTRFTEVVHYGWTSLDPIEVFIKSGSTSVLQACRSGMGVVGASFREFPAEAREQVHEVIQSVAPWGLGGVVEVGASSAPLFQTPVGPGRCGMVISAGLNAVAAVEENGIPTVSKAMTTLVQYDELEDVLRLADRVGS